MEDVIAIGSTTLDTFWKTDFKEVKWKTPIGRGFVVPLGEKFGNESLYTTIGGNAANAAVTFARQKESVKLFTYVGDDIAGKEIIARLKEERIATHLIQTKKGRRSAQSVLFLQKGERSILTYHGAINEFSLKSISLERLKAKWWYVSLPGDSYKQLDILLRYAKKYGIKVALNPSGNHLQGEGKKQLLKHLRELSLLLVNEGEAARITGIPFAREKEVFKKLDALVPGIVVITRGKKGVVVSDGAHIFRAGTFREKTMVDRTGAGDAFGSGFVAGLIHTKERCQKEWCNPNNISYAIRLGSANATSVVEHMGATQGVLTKREFGADERWKGLKIVIEKVKSKK